MKQTSDKLEFQEMSFASWFQLLGAVNLLVFGLFSGLFSGSFLACLLIGLLLVRSVEIDTMTFDKNLGHMTIKRHKLLFAKTAKTKVVKHLQDISGVERQQRRTSDSSDTYRVCLVLKSGKRRVPLTSSFNSNLGDKHKKAEVIANFLDIRNYGLGGFSSQESSSEELQWKTVEEEILHWETAIKSDPTDADAYMKLALALISQDKTKNKEQAMGYLKRAEAIFKSQGYDEEAWQVALLYPLAS
jgi:tetratricopeptide (TPR) repeat protein